MNINIPESTYISPSIGWSRIFFGVSCDGWPQASSADAARFCTMFSYHSVTIMI